MENLKATPNRWGGISIDPAALPADADLFCQALEASLAFWRAEGYRVAWLEIPIDHANLIPVAVGAGFVFHHSKTNYLMLTCQIETDAFVPPYASHYIGAGGVVLNDHDELLVVWESAHRQSGHKYYKLPGGALQQGEHLVDAVIREVEEETGIRTRFETLVCFRHWHGYRFGTSDIYFVCRLSPLSHDIHRQEDEIAECLWMPVQEYLTSELVGAFNRQIVQAALDRRCWMVPTEVEGYSPEEREVFMPQL